MSYHAPALPLVSSSGTLPTISAATLASLLVDRPSACALYGFDELRVLDCRFDFEYEGGHIDGAVWLPDSSPSTLDALLEEAAACRLCVVVHCEFSAHRGPAVYRALRRRDRELNGIAHFPRLHLPELYLLQDGYAAFHTAYPTLCRPQPGAYVAMVDGRFQAQLKVRWRQRKADATRAARGREPSPVIGAITLPDAPFHSRTQTVPLSFTFAHSSTTPPPAAGERPPFLSLAGGVEGGVAKRFSFEGMGEGGGGGGGGWGHSRPLRSQSVLSFASLAQEAEAEGAGRGEEGEQGRGGS